MTPRIQTLPPALLLAGLTACGGVQHHLGEYDFSQGSVAVAFYEPPSPEILSGGIGLPSGGSAIGALISAGGRAAREVEAQKAIVRLDSASQNVDFAGKMAERTLERTSRYLGASPVADEASADYVLEVDLETIGLNSASSTVRLMVAGEAVLLDSGDGREIWRVRVHSSDPVSRNVGDSTLNDIIGAGTLNNLTVEDFEVLLNQLAEYAGDEIARALREDLRDVREG